MNEFSITAQRGRIQALRFGNPNGAPVLALHGWLDNAASFVPMASYLDRKSTRLNSSHVSQSRMPSSA